VQLNRCAIESQRAVALGILASVATDICSPEAGPVPGCWRAGGISTRLMTWMTPFDAVTHAGLHVSAVLHSYETDTFLPPHK
jgi:hypothetical protein